MIKNYKLALTVLLVSCSLLHGMENTVNKLQLKELLELIRPCRSNLLDPVARFGNHKPKVMHTTVIVLSNPKTLFIMDYNIIGRTKYAETSDSDKEILKEKLVQIIGHEKYYTRIVERDSLGYLRTDNYLLTNKEIEKLSKIKEVAAVGCFEDLDLDDLKKRRENGYAITKSVFKLLRRSRSCPKISSKK